MFRSKIEVDLEYKYMSVEEIIRFRLFLKEICYNSKRVVVLNFISKPLLILKFFYSHCIRINEISQWLPELSLGVKDETDIRKSIRIQLDTSLD